MGSSPMMAASTHATDLRLTATLQYSRQCWRKTGQTNSGSMKVQDYGAQTVKNFIKYLHTPKAGSDIVEMARKSAQP